MLRKQLLFLLIQCLSSHLVEQFHTRFAENAITEKFISTGASEEFLRIHKVIICLLKVTVILL